MPYNHQAKSYQKLIQDTLFWLKEKVFPLWLAEGVDHDSGIFVENLSFDGKALNSLRRCLVQARQIYAFSEGARLKVLDDQLARKLVIASTRSLIQSYSLPSGAFVNSVDIDGQHLNRDVDLYTQAFVLFALARTYEVSQDQNFKKVALKLVTYLLNERRNSAGGFTEIKENKTLFQSNPHMHLFEAVISWLKIDSDSVWKSLAEELYNLCTTRFIDGATGILAEHFDKDWQPLRVNGHFLFEPGHHYEWSWLFVQFQQLIPGRNNYSKKLFDLAERMGLTANGELAFDEVWSDGKVNKKSSRFWPQSERIKSAVVLRETGIADVAMKSLIKNFLLMEQGLWQDTKLESGRYSDQPVKASSLYHIINAISEYVTFRENERG